MVLSKTLSRSLRAREDDSASEPYSDELDVSSPSVLDTGEGADIPSSDNESGQDGEEDVELVSGLHVYLTAWAETCQVSVCR